jgi:hypothetical protein
MPEKETLDRARQDKREGKSASTQAGEFVRQEMDHIREGKHGARSAKQAIAIGLSEARRAGVDLPPPPGKGKATAKKAAPAPKVSAKRSRAASAALKSEGHEAASPAALAKQARGAAAKRTPAERSATAKKAARTRKRNES